MTTCPECDSPEVSAERHTVTWGQGEAEEDVEEFLCHDCGYEWEEKSR